MNKPAPQYVSLSSLPEMSSETWELLLEICALTPGGTDCSAQYDEDSSASAESGSTCTAHTRTQRPN
jgi:hypothetical protein